MPVYTCTTNTDVLDGRTKNDLAGAITRIHAEVNHVPTTYVNVVFHEVAAENLYTDALPATALLINGWVRQGHPAREATRLALAIADAAAGVTGLPEAKVLVVLQSSPASAAVEGGRVLPEPGQEAAWLAAQQPE